jgi:hypothetical protein
MSIQPEVTGYAVIDDGTSLVVNVIVWDGVQPYTPPEGNTLVPLPYEDEDGVRRYQGGIGWSYNPKATKNKFVDNRPTEETEA